MRMLLALSLLSLPFVAVRADDLRRARIVVLPAGAGYVRTHFSGRVLAVGDETFTLKPEGNPTTQESFSFHPDGAIKEKRIYVLDTPQDPTTFMFDDSLLMFNGRKIPAGRWAGLGQSPRYDEHRIADLRPNDLVWIRCRRIKGIDYCNSIQIQRRPGGKVPPAIGDGTKPHKYRVDVRMNAEQFAEETFAPWMLLQFCR